MSFRDIRTSREARKTKSFVKPLSDAPDNPEGQARAPRGSSETRDGGSSSEMNREDATLTAVSHVPNDLNAEAVPVPAGWYAELPSFLSVKRTKERGRGIWTNCGIPAGTVLVSVKPHVYTLSRSQLKLYCTSCCAPQPTTGFKKCSKCKTVFYCGTTCQNADWHIHKSECEALLRWAASAPPETDGAKYTLPPEAVRCLARIIWRRKKSGSSSIWWREINEMQSKRDGLAQSMIDAQVHLAHAVVRYMGISGQEELEVHGIHGISELVDLISKFTMNSFTLTTPSLSPIGVSVSPVAALINHSCDPNVAVVFPRCSKKEPELQIVAIQDISANSELYTSYIDVTLPTAQRRKDLKETYNFTCACVVCVHSPGRLVEDWRERMWCPNQCGATCLIPSGGDDTVRCLKCGSSFTDIGEVLDSLHVGQQALDKATSLQSSEPETALRLIQNAVQLLGSRMPPSAHPLLALIRLGQSLLISQLAQGTSQAVLETSVQFAMAYVKGLSSILRLGHPVRAVAVAELGKLLAVDELAPPSSDVPVVSPMNDKAPLQTARGVFELQAPKGPERLQRAVEVLQQAYAELCIAFGKTNGGGQVGRSVREMLVSLEKELGVWRSGIRDTLKDTLAEQSGKTVSSGH